MRVRNALIAVTAICIIAACVLWVFRKNRSPSTPDIVLITLDTTRLDHLSCYGHPQKVTPTLDALAGEGIKYARAISTSSWTLPSHASIFTGMLPTHHSAHMGVDESAKADKPGGFNVYTLHPMIPTLAEELRKAGYHTRGIIAGPTIHSKFGLGRGFDYYDDRLPAIGRERDAEAVTSLATLWLDKHCSQPDRKPFFLFLNYYDPHSPYRAPAPWGNTEIPREVYDITSPLYEDVSHGRRALTGEEQKTLLAQYYDEVRFMDNQIGRLFDKMKRLNVYESAMIIAVSDHGEFFGEHGLIGHGRVLYEELVHVPMILKYPRGDNRRGLTVEKPVSIMGIMPTVLNRVGQPVPSSVTCGSLDDDNQVLVTEIFRDLVLIGSHGNQYDRDLKAAYFGKYKWIWHSGGKHELYDLSQDPGEKNNLFGTKPDIEERFQSKLKPLIEESQKLSSLSTAELDQELRERLQALGYIR